MITNNYTPYAGGVVTSIQTYTQALQPAGHTVYIITLDFGVDVSDPPYVYRVPACFHVRYYSNPLPVPWRVQYYVSTFVRRCNPDVVHIHSPFLLGRAVVRVARELGLPTVFTYHSLYERFVQYLPVPQRWARKGVLARVHDLCNRVDAVIAPSNYVRQRVWQHNPAIPVWHIPSPIDTRFFVKENTPRGLQRDRIYILSVGRFQPEKRLDHVIDAFARMQTRLHTTLVLVGFGAQYQYLRWYAYQVWGLSEDQVIFVVQPHRNAIIRWYRAASLFISASSEAQGLVFAEACASGVPIVAYRTGGAVDVVQHRVNGFLVDNIDQMARYVSHALENQSRWLSLVNEAYAVGNAYHPSTLTKSMLSCYAQVIHVTYRKNPVSMPA